MACSGLVCGSSIVSSLSSLIFDQSNRRIGSTSCHAHWYLLPTGSRAGRRPCDNGTSSWTGPTCRTRTGSTAGTALHRHRCRTSLSMTAAPLDFVTTSANPAPCFCFGMRYLEST